MQTATEVSRAERQETLQRAMFEDMIEHFIKKWKPEDQHDRYRFEAELFSIIRQLYVDAQKPALEQLTKLVSAMPFITMAPK